MKSKMTMLKLKISTKGSHNDDRWQHQEITDTPFLRYDYAEDNRWKATDSRLSDRSAVHRFSHTYWQHTTVNPSQTKYHYIGKRRVPNGGRITTNLSLYEEELEREIHRAIERVNLRFQKKFCRDFENHFQDSLVKFINAKEAA